MYDPTKPYKKQIFELIKKTWANNPYIYVEKDVYSVITPKKIFKEIDHTDGVGSKGVYHWQKRTFKEAALDALAMNLNDLALMRAIPFKLQNHILLPEDDHEAILEIVSALSEECTKRKIAITGGETSIHSNIHGLDIGMTVTGAVSDYKKNEVKLDDLLVGLKSSGLMSNGFSKIRELFGEEVRPEFMEPTAIYLDQILKLNEKYAIHGMMHMTGGSYAKLKDILPKGAQIEIVNDHSLKPQKIFFEIYKRGVTDEEMYKTFNCGVGFLISTSEKEAKEITAKYSDTAIIGRVSKGSGEVKVSSMFSDKVVIY